VIKRGTGEFDHQCALFEWARLPSEQKKYPGLDLLSCSLNGVRLTPSQACKASKSGMLSGEADVRLPVARGGYHGLSIELKFGKGRPSKNQLWYHGRMCEEGHFARFAWSWIDAKNLIIRYLTGLEVRAE
jgi:hypothetical protein